MHSLSPSISGIADLPFQGDRSTEWGTRLPGARLSGRADDGRSDREYVDCVDSAGHEHHHGKGQVSMFKWPWRSDGRKAVEEEREVTRKRRGELATALVDLDRQRYALDEMVARSMELLKGEKP